MSDRWTEIYCMYNHEVSTCIYVHIYRIDVSTYSVLFTNKMGIVKIAHVQDRERKIASLVQDRCRISFIGQICVSKVVIFVMGNTHDDSSMSVRLQLHLQHPLLPACTVLHQLHQQQEMRCSPHSQAHKSHSQASPLLQGEYSQEQHSAHSPYTNSSSTSSSLLHLHCRWKTYSPLPY